MYASTLTFFGAKYKGIDVFSVFVPMSGITYESQILELYNVAHWDNMSYEQFIKKPLDYQEMTIAAYRSIHQAEAVKAHKERPKRKGKK